MKIQILLGSLAAALSLSALTPMGYQPLAAPSDHRAHHHTVPLALLAADVTNLTVYGPTARGVRVDVAFKGTLSGRLAGTMEGVDYSTIRADGVTELDVRARITTVDQALISVEIQGLMTGGQIRDTHVRFLTAAPAYAYLQEGVFVGYGQATTEKLSIQYLQVN